MKNIFHVPHTSKFIPKEYLNDYTVSLDELVELNEMYHDKYISDIIEDINSNDLLSFEYSRLFCDVERFNDDTEEMNKYGRGILYTHDHNFNLIRNVKNKDSIKKLYNSLSYARNKIDDFILLFNKKYDSILDNYLQNYDIIMYINEIIKLIDSYIGVSESEKKLLGEVFTPFKLINEMLDTLPKEVWTNPHLKWLDPANGIGNFPIMIVKRLLDGLVDFEPDYDKRYKHIMENMIYVCDINPKNMFIFNNLFNPNDDIKLNTHRGSFLEEPFDIVMKDVWGVDKFDIVVGNPPYQEKKGTNKKTQSLWNLFVEKYFNILKCDGYICNVHPSGWRNGGGNYKNIQNILKNKQILYLSINDENKGLKIFKSETRFDFYSLCNKDDQNFITTIKGQDDKLNKINLSKMEFIPNNNFEIFEKLLAKNEEEKVQIIADSSYHTQRYFLSNKKEVPYVNPCVYTVKSNDILTLWWSSKNENGHFGIPKLIWSNFRIISAGSFVDKTGEYALTQFSYGIVDSVDNLIKIKKVFDSKKFRDLMESCSISDMKINPKIISYFKKDFWKDEYFSN